MPKVPRPPAIGLSRPICPDRPLRLLLPLAFLALAASSGRAQIEYPTPPPKEEPAESAETQGPELPEPESGAENAPPAAPRGPSYWLNRDGRVIEVFRRFESEREITEEVIRKYVDELRAYGLDQPREIALEAVMSHPDPRSADLAARVLEFVGEPEDAYTLVDAAASLGNVAVASICLESALRLNGGWLPDRAVRLLDHPKRQVRVSAESRLARQPHPTYVPRLLQILRYGRDSDTRLRAARLLAFFTDRPDVRDALRDGLSDKSVSVAFEATAALAGNGSPDELDRLHQEILSTEPSVELGYLLYAMLKLQDERGVLLVDEELLPKLEVCLGEADLFLSGTAAALLAENDYRSLGQSTLGSLEKELVHVLVKAVGGVSFYPQYARFSPLGEASLARFTGEDYSHTDRSAWLEWLAENYEEFRAVRGTLVVDELTRSTMEVHWETAGEPPRALVGHASALRGADTRLLGPSAMEELLAALDRAELLDARVLPGNYGPVEEDVERRIEIVVGDRRKPLSFRGEASTDWLPELFETLGRMYDDQLWQRLAPSEGAEAFVQTRLPVWDGADAAGRVEFELELTRARLVRLSDEVLSAWCSFLAADPALDLAWPEDLARDFLDQIPRRSAYPGLAFQVLDTALRRPDPALTAPFLEVVQDLSEPLRSDLMLQGLTTLGPQVAAASLQDPRLPVRVAAARALGRAGEVGREALLAATRDPNALVVRMAVRSLGELGDRSAVPRLMEFARSELGSKEVRKEALWALGAIGDPQAVEVVAEAAVPGQDPGVRISAIQALGKLPGDTADQSFTALFPAFAGTDLEITYLRALESRGAGSARRILAPHLRSANATVARRSAIQLGRLGAPHSASHLVELLTRAPQDREILDSLTFAVGADFRSMPDPAGVYAAWWRENSRLEPSYWLERAAANLGMPLPERFDDPESVAPEEAVRALLTLLKEGPPHLRPAASYYLNELTGVDAPALLGTMPMAVVEKVAAGWDAWIAEQANG